VFNRISRCDAEAYFRTWMAVDVIEEVENDRGYLLWWIPSGRLPLRNNAKGVKYEWVDPSEKFRIPAIGSSTSSTHEVPNFGAGFPGVFELLRNSRGDLTMTISCCNARTNVIERTRKACSRSNRCARAASAIVFAFGLCNCSRVPAWSSDCHISALTSKSFDASARLTNGSTSKVATSSRVFFRTVEAKKVGGGYLIYEFVVTLTPGESRYVTTHVTSAEDGGANIPAGSGLIDECHVHEVIYKDGTSVSGPVPM
jgi:hypothetical protein